MKVNKKQSECKRKVIILNYKWKTFIPSKKMIRNIEKLKITIQCNNKTSDDEIKRYKLSILKPNTRERIVPTCIRHKCKKNCYKDQHVGKDQHIKTQNKINKTKYIHTMESKNEKFLHPELMYDDISSGSLSSYEEIETLISSTRTKMKESNVHWEFLPRFGFHLNKTEMNGSINSLDTLFIEKHEHEDTIKSNIRAYYSLTRNEENIYVY